MENLGEIAEEPRAAEGDDSGQDNERGPIQQNHTKRKRSRKRGSQSSAQSLPSGNVPEGRLEENEGGRRKTRQPAIAKNRDALPPQEDHKARFYENYRKVAEEYDKEFLKKYDEDLDTTLIFAGLFSAVTSAFIILVDSQLKPDSGDETAALLRVLIYKIDNATFGNDVPTLPQWTGPPPAMVDVQSILFASLSASLLSAFLAMLGKQWLNRYASTDMRGSATERGQSRQRKLNGIVAWYFDSVMESLPVMLQVALLLLGSALSRYLWEISRTIASVVLGLTSLGLLFYIFILVVGTAWESCPYQTPASYLLRYLGPRIWRIARSAASTAGNIPKVSEALGLAITAWDRTHWSSWQDIMMLSVVIVVRVPIRFIVDICHLGRATVRAFSALTIGTYHLLYRLYFWSRYSSPRGLDQQTAILDLRCVSWTLQTSLDQLVRASTLKHLTNITEFAHFDPDLLMHCFNLFVGCISINSQSQVAVIRGLEELATLSASCFSQIFHHLSVIHPTPSALADLRRRYGRVVPPATSFQGLPFYHIMEGIHNLVHQGRFRRYFHWEKYRPSNQELIPFARNMVKVAREKHQDMQTRKVPRWILRFVLHCLSLNPPSPPSVITDCLSIIAIDLDLDPSIVSIFDESVRADHISGLIFQKLEIMATIPSTDLIFRTTRKATCALLPHAVRLAQGQQPWMIDAILRIIPNSTYWGSVWNATRPYIYTNLFDGSSSACLDQHILLLSPYIGLGIASYSQTPLAVTKWAAAVSATSYSEAVGRSVIDALLQLTRNSSLPPQTPEIWGWLNGRPSLPPVCWGRFHGTMSEIVDHIRSLGDIEILKSYFLLVWSEWDSLYISGLTAMETTVRDEFSGIAMWRHREDLADRLDHVLEQLDRGLEYFKQHNPQIDEAHIPYAEGQYRKLKEVLAEVDREAMETLSKSHLTVACALPLLCP